MLLLIQDFQLLLANNNDLSSEWSNNASDIQSKSLSFVESLFEYNRGAF